ncbi:S24 family peptidase [Methylosinus sp. LW4]|uniref:S24 family peptidase n=1 Tax=Methylosinus sp. LW4 TaxID=136993 RepID=UPI00039C8877|nr:LexA family transcriptional regulator [Methylosinus sp. LW4]
MPETKTNPVFDRAGLARRLGQAVDAAGGPARILRDAGVTSSTYSRYLNGETEASGEKLGRIAEVTGVSLDWLVLDRGAPIFEAGAPPAIPLGPDMAQIPPLRIGAAAEGEIVGERIAFPRALLRRLGTEIDALEFLRARGDSMRPTIEDGAIVLIDRSQRDIIGDAVYLVSLDDGPLIRRVRRNVDGAITLISDNRACYEPERLERADAERLCVHGRIRWTESLL